MKIRIVKKGNANGKPLMVCPEFVDNDGVTKK